jgi:hypothetical protein
LVVVGSHLLPSPVLCGLGARGHLLSGPQPAVHHVVTARALAPPLTGGFVGGLRPRDLPGGRHPSYAASTFCRFRTFTLRIHGYLQASHNGSERALRRVALGRKNYLFVHDGDAGASIAGLYSLVATCEARRINPFEYLADVLARVQDHPKNAIDDLLPGAWADGRDHA